MWGNVSGTIQDRRHQTQEQEEEGRTTTRTTITRHKGKEANETDRSQNAVLPVFMPRPALGNLCVVTFKAQHKTDDTRHKNKKKKEELLLLILMLLLRLVTPKPKKRFAARWGVGGGGAFPPDRWKLRGGGWWTHPALFVGSWGGVVDPPLCECSWGEGVVEPTPSVNGCSDCEWLYWQSWGGVPPPQVEEGHKWANYQSIASISDVFNSSTYIFVAVLDDHLVTLCRITIVVAP